MDFETAAAVIAAAWAWALAGLAVTVVFLAVGLDRIDPAARGVWAFRPLLVPGIVLLWPLVLARWYAVERSRGTVATRPAPRSAHRVAWLILAVLLPAILMTAFVHRAPKPESPPVQRIDAPTGRLAPP